MGKRREKIQLTRRQALSILCATGAEGLMQSPLAFFVQTIVDGMINNVRAQSATTPPRRFVYIHMNGAPARWMFDCPIQPNGPTVDTKTDNPMVGTQFTFSGSALSGSTYTSVPVTGSSFYAPYLWSTNVPTASGGSAPLSSLLTNTIMVRGVDLVVNGHSNNMLRAIRPNPTSASLDGLVADNSPSPIPAIGYFRSKDIGFASRSGVGRVYNGEDLPGLMKPFTPVANSATTNATIDAQVEASMASLANADDSTIYGAQAVYRDRANAKTLIKKNFTNLQATYDGLKAKYKTIINNSFYGTNIPGLTDKALPCVSSDIRFQLAGYGTSGGTSYQRIMLGHADLRTILQANTSIDNLAGQLAMTEFLFINDLSSAAVVVMENVNNLKIESSLTNTGGVVPTLTNFSMYYDQHETGMYATLLINSMLYRALGACMIEFTNQLKAKGIFDETVIQIAGEFGRDPARIDRCSSSEHGFTGQSSTIISGAVKSFKVIGNITSNNTYTYYDANNVKQTAVLGAWGRGAPISGLGNRTANIGNLASTVATLLRVQTPTPNDPSLVLYSGGDYVSSVGKPQNVA